jgi:hypothetical protein
LHAKARGEGVKIGGAHGAERNAKLALLIFADFAGENLPGREAVKGEAYDVIRGDVAGEVV